MKERSSQNTIEITLLVNNTTSMEGLHREHGLSWSIRIGRELIIFDTGQKTALFHNAPRLGVDLEETTRVVLSHGHYDHSGGLSELLRIAPGILVYSHPAVTIPRFSFINDENGHSISMPDDACVSLQGIGSRWIRETAPLEIVPGIWTTGPIPRICEFEEPERDLCLDARGETPDPFEDDQAIFINTSEGTVVLLGCAHSGVVNTLLRVRELTDSAPLFAVFGGMHLVQASSERIESTIRSLNSFFIQHIGPCHCSGEKATSAMEAAMCGVHRCAVGFRMHLYQVSAQQKAFHTNA